MSDIQEQIKKAIREGTVRTSLEDIKNRGFSHVKVLDNNRISELIFQAVEAVLNERNANLLDEEKSQVADTARAQFRKLLEDQKRAEQRAEQMEAAKRKLEEELEKFKTMVSSEYKPSETGDSGKAAPGSVAQSLQEQLQKMTERQKTLLDKYAAVDEKYRLAEAESVKNKVKVDELLKQIDEMKARGQAAPSVFLDEINALKDQRDDLKRRLGILNLAIQSLVQNEYLLKNQMPPLQGPPPGHGVAVLIGDRKTPRTGIKVRYEPGKAEPIIEFPKGKGPAPMAGIPSAEAKPTAGT